MNTMQITRRTLIKQGAIAGAGRQPGAAPADLREAGRGPDPGGRLQAPAAHLLERRHGLRELPAHRHRDQLGRSPTPMKSLEPYKNKMTIYANIRRAQDNAKGSHQAGTSGIWTAARMLGTGTGASGSRTRRSTRSSTRKVPQQTDIPVLNLDCHVAGPGQPARQHHLRHGMPADPRRDGSQPGVRSPVHQRHRHAGHRHRRHGRSPGGREAARPAQERARSGALRAADPAGPPGRAGQEEARPAPRAAPLGRDPAVGARGRGRRRGRRAGRRRPRTRSPSWSTPSRPTTTSPSSCSCTSTWPSRRWPPIARAW